MNRGRLALKASDSRMRGGRRVVRQARLPAVVGKPESWLARRNGSEFECEMSSLLNGSAEFDVSARAEMRNER